jgi:hypothetical protein
VLFFHRKEENFRRKESRQQHAYIGPWTHCPYRENLLYISMNISLYFPGSDFTQFCLRTSQLLSISLPILLCTYFFFKLIISRSKLYLALLQGLTAGLAQGGAMTKPATTATWVRQRSSTTPPILHYNHNQHISTTSITGILH